MSITQEHIAEYLGVSRKSVVRAFNGHGKISEATRQRILKAARELGYTENTNSEARALAARRNGKRVLHHSIGLAGFVGSRVPYYSHLINGIHRAAEQSHNMMVMLPSSPGPSWERIDGVLAHGGLLTNRDAMPSGLPVVHLTYVIPGCAAVVADNFDGAYQATNHLLQLGHRRIGYMIDPYPQDKVTWRRLEGYKSALAAAEIAFDPSWLGGIVTGPNNLVNGREFMREWLAAGWPKLGMTGLLIQNDRMAIGAVEALREVGVRVPQDLSIVGFDGAEDGKSCIPPLTSVEVPLEAIGERATELLLRQINGETTEPEVITLPVRLRVRASTAPPRNHTESFCRDTVNPPLKRREDHAHTARRKES